MDAEAEIKALRRQVETTLALYQGLLAATTLVADYHPNRPALLNAYPAMKDLLEGNTLFGPMSEESREAALNSLQAVLRIPRSA